jgi:hypothetical protein
MADAPTPNALTRAIVTARVIALDAIEGAIEALTWLANQLRSRSQPTDGAIAADVGDAAAAAFGKVWQRWEPLAERLRSYAPQPWRDRLTPYGVTGILVGGLVLISLALGSGDRARAGAPVVQPREQPISQPNRSTDRPGKLRPLLNRNPERNPESVAPTQSPIAPVRTPVRTPVRSAPVSPAPIVVPDELSAPEESLPLPTRTPLAVVRDRLVGSKRDGAPSIKSERTAISVPPAPVIAAPVIAAPVVAAPVVPLPLVEPTIVAPITAVPTPPIPTIKPKPVVQVPIRTSKPIAPAVPKTPEQKLLADLQASIVRQVRDLSEGLLVSLQANFTTQQLTAKLAPGWYDLAPAQQDRLAQTLFNQVQRLSFRQLELLNDRGEPIARSPVIGQQMVILQRTIADRSVN